MDILTKALANANPCQVNNVEPMNSAFLQQLQQALTAVQIVQCLQSAREELENKHLPAQMAQLASYLTIDLMASQPTLSNQEESGSFQTMVPSSKPQSSNRHLDVVSESSEALSDSSGCPTSPISHLPSTTNSLNQLSSMFEKSLPDLDLQGQSGSDIFCSVNNPTQDMAAFGSGLSENENNLFIDVDFEIQEDEKEWIENVLLNDEHDFSFNQENNPSTSLVEHGGFRSNVASEFQEGCFTTLRDSDKNPSNFGIPDGEIPSVSGMKRKLLDEEAEFGSLDWTKSENNSPSGNRTHSSSCKGPRPRQPRGTATDPQSVSARKRRERISKKIRTLQELVPNARSMDTASMLEQAIHYVQSLEDKVQRLKYKKIRA